MLIFAAVRTTNNTGLCGGGRGWGGCLGDYGTHIVNQSAWHTHAQNRTHTHAAFNHNHSSVERESERSTVSASHNALHSALCHVNHFFPCSLPLLHPLLLLLLLLYLPILVLRHLLLLLPPDLTSSRAVKTVTAEGQCVRAAVHRGCVNKQ